MPAWLPILDGLTPTSIHLEAPIHRYTMGSTRTSSPTALLWAHQLKREHNHLLNRIKTLEAANSTLNSRMNATEASAQNALKATDSVKELSLKVQAIEADDESQQRRFKELDHDRGERFGKLGEGVQKIEKQLKALETALHNRDDESQEKRKCAAREKELVVDRIEKLEGECAKLKEGAAKGEKLARKDDSANTKVLNRRIEALEARRKEENLKVKTTLERLENIEKGWSTTQEQLKKVLDKLDTTCWVPKPVAAPRPTPLVASSSPLVAQVSESPLAGRQGRRCASYHPGLDCTVLMTSTLGASRRRRSKFINS
jgi:chromosome segregation ATPase